MTRPTRFARGFTLSIAECFFPPSLGACSQASASTTNRVSLVIFAGCNSSVEGARAGL